ncbi:MAG: HAD family hydrolase [Gammaproteobacteria bacterium]|nr:HAD family hydrolase [Gammaproteobacteria bacterium]
MRSKEAVLFDLDDTLVDFQYSRRHGLRAVQELLPGLAPVPLEELELVHDEELHANFLRTLGGGLSDDEARIQRIGGVCRRYGLEPDEKRVAKAAVSYARAQQSNLRLVPGASQLLHALRGRVKIGVITNGPSAQQRDKLKRCDIDPGDLDVLAISEEVGTTKPDPAIFRYALAGLGVPPGRVTMVGDSWENDVLPAHKNGMAAVWLNRYRRTCPDPGLAIEIHELDPVGNILEILGFETPQG